VVRGSIRNFRSAGDSLKVNKKSDTKNNREAFWALVEKTMLNK